MKRGMFLDLIKNTYKERTANIILCGKKPQAFPLKIRTARMSPLITPFQHLIEVLKNVTRQGKEIKGKQTGKEEINYLQII